MSDYISDVMIWVRTMAHDLKTNLWTNREEQIDYWLEILEEKYGGES